jgi:hypothetical protein
MIKEKLSSTTKFAKEHSFEIGAVAFVAGIVGLEIVCPGTITVEKEIPTMKIIHVHVTE